ncbi:hypothetical protein [Parasphingorhabdus sp.]|uniref:hypothetical protein n=1 Tax=Parasphingorhabdus sp. TaxID=2709688 RepID=UPI0030017A27
MVGTVGTVAIMLSRQRPRTIDLADLAVPPGAKSNAEVLKALQDPKDDAANGADASFGNADKRRAYRA